MPALRPLRGEVRFDLDRLVDFLWLEYDTHNMGVYDPVAVGLFRAGGLDGLAVMDLNSDESVVRGNPW